MMGWSLSSSVSVEGRVSQPEFGYNSAYDFVAGNSFRAMGIPLLKGRVFTEHDDSTKATRVVIFDQALAKKVFPDEDPLGKRIHFWGDLWEVVGVVGSIRHHGLDGPAYERIYLPQAFGFWSSSLVVRTKVPPLGLVELTRKEILAVDPEQPVSIKYFHDEPDDRRLRSAAPSDTDTAHYVCERGSAVGRHWPLWCNGLRRGATHSRDRRAHGSGRTAS